MKTLTLTLSLSFTTQKPHILSIFTFNLVFALQVHQVQTLTLNILHHAHFPLQIDERLASTPPPWRWQR
ncbi:hypothetical protein Hanom_Chr00s097665g01802051 [Helianthus anomalus]